MFDADDQCYLGRLVQFALWDFTLIVRGMGPPSCVVPFSIIDRISSTVHTDDPGYRNEK